MSLPRVELVDNVIGHFLSIDHGALLLTKAKVERAMAGRLPATSSNIFLPKVHGSNLAEEGKH